MKATFSRYVAVSVLMVGMATLAVSQQVKPITIEPAVQFSTADFSPQIRIPLEYQTRQASPNESTQMLLGPSNSLVAGNVGTNPRGTLKAKFKGIGFTGYVPPDPDMAVGPNHIVAAVNTDIAFFNKATGVKTFQQPMDNTGFFSGIASGDVYSDTKCFYDKGSGRFFVAILEIDFANSISKVLIAVSDDSDPNGTWYKYRIEAKVSQGGNDFWLDYPGFGFNKDAVIVTGNMFPFASGGVFNQIITIPKAPMLTGAAATGHSVVENSFVTIQPSRTADPTQTISYAASALNSTTIRLYAIANPAVSPTITRKDIPVPAFQYPEKVPTGGGRFLDGLDGRLYNCAFRSGRLVAAHTTKVATGQMKVRWYEFQIGSWPSSGNPTLRQSGDIVAPSGNSTHMPAVSTNAAGDIAVIYSRSGPNLNPEVCQSSRMGSDPLGQIGAPVVLQSSSGIYGGGGTNRWGDYFAVEIDPTDEVTFWGHAMYGVAGGAWETGIFKWSVSSGANLTKVAPNNAMVLQGIAVNGDLSSLLQSENNKLSIQSILVDKYGQPISGSAAPTAAVASLSADFDIDLSAGPLQSVKVSIESSISKTGATGQYFAYNWNTGTYISLGSFSIGTIDKVTSVVIPKAKLASYVDGTGNVRILFRAINSVKAGRPGVVPPPFIFNIDQVELGASFN
ncbi:MAG: hypothetical protein IT203_07405 [Fimbriimonadaceae bacterium]|nr:hypothetical protein [Fimbriimonadaceae bacterium]